MMAWTASFASGILTVQHNGLAADVGVLSVTNGVIQLDDGSGTVASTGANLGSLSGPIQINAGTADGTVMVIDNDVGSFFNINSFVPTALNPSFNYNGGTGIGSGLSVVGRSNLNDTFVLSNTVASPGFGTFPRNTTSGTLNVTNSLGVLFVNFSSLNGALAIDGRTGTVDSLTILGTAGGDTMTVAGSQVNFQPFLGAFPGAQGMGGELNFAAFENLSLNGMDGADLLTLNDPSVATTVNGGNGNEDIRVLLPSSNRITIDGGGDTDTLRMNGTAASDQLFVDNSTVVLMDRRVDRIGDGISIGERVNYVTGSIEVMEINGMAGDDVLTVQAPPRNQPPFPSLALPGTFRFYGDAGPTSSPTSLGDNQLRLFGNNPVLNQTLGTDVLSVGDFNSGSTVQMIQVQCSVIYGLGGDDSLISRSTGNIALGVPAVPVMIIGGDGNDTIVGGDGFDALLGGNGLDTIQGGVGNDYLFPDQDEFGFIFNVANETIDGGANTLNGGDVGVRGVITAFVAAQLGVPFDLDTATGFNSNFFERLLPTVDPQNPTAHLFQVTPALLALEEAFRTNCAVMEFGPERNLRGQFATYGAFVGRAYDDYLVGKTGRAGVSASEINFWIQQGQQGLSIPAMQASLLSSDELRQTFRLPTNWVRDFLFPVVLGRGPRASTNPALDEMTVWAGPLLNNDTPEARFNTALRLLATLEGQSDQVDVMYQQFFPTNNTPSQTDRQAILADLAAGFPMEQLALELFKSGGDYFNYAVATNVGQVGYVGGLYRDVLNRPTINIGEVTYWTNLLALGVTNRDQIANEFLTSTENRAQLIDSYYRQFLGRGADAAGINFWLGVLSRGGRDEDVLAAIVASPEFYFSRGGTSDLYVRAVYSEVLLRSAAPSQQEVDYWISQLAVSTRGEILARADIVLAFQASDEYRKILIDGWYQVYLRRPPTALEEATLLNLLRAGATQETAQLAILKTR